MRSAQLHAALLLAIACTLTACTGDRPRRSCRASGRVARWWATAERPAAGLAAMHAFERAVERTASKDLGAFYRAWFRGTRIPAEKHLYPGKLRR